ncbi:MAG: hypothetical protein QOE69_1815 [Thermoleophilaceae bacterium]|jgi:ketosteroid isomerase-like protein|nr:hypothetical protein [Thermoleophilaceae bacterium]
MTGRRGVRSNRLLAAIATQDRETLDELLADDVVLAVARMTRALAEPG